MKAIRLRYVHEYTDRRGKVRRYFRRHGRRVALPGAPGSPEFMAAYNEAMKETERAAPPSARLVQPYSVAYVIRSYLGSQQFARLKPVTQSTYRNVLRRIENECGDKSAISMNRQDVVGILDKQSAGSVKNWLAMFRILSRHMLDMGWRETDPTLRLRKPKAGKGFEVWTIEDAARFLKAHPVGSRARLAFLLLALTGQRRSDVVAMGRQHVTSGRLVITQSKTGNRVSLPVLPMLQAEIDRLPRDQMTFLVTRQGAPFTAAGFGNHFREVCDEAGVGKSAHGLRKFLGTLLAETGSSHKEVMAILGHVTESEATHYIKSASIEALSDQAMERLMGTEQIRKLANL